MLYGNIPLELREIAQWINWRYVTLENGKQTKIPLNPHSLFQASVIDPTHWGTFEQAVANARHYNIGIGWVFTRAAGKLGIDVDHFNSTNPDHMLVLNVFKSKSYVEWSPSNTGIHIICNAIIPAGVNNRHVGLEMYGEGRFFTFTGNVVTGFSNPIGNCQIEASELYEKIASHAAQVEVVAQPETRADNDIIQAACNAGNGAKFQWLFFGQGLIDGKWQRSAEFPSQSEADQALINILQFHTPNPEQIKRIFMQSMLATTLSRKPGHEQDYLNRTIKRSFDRTLPVPDFNLAAADPTKRKPSTLGAAAAPIAAEPAPVRDNPYLEKAPGLVGLISDYILAASPRPLPALATLAALLQMAAMCGRSWNVSGTGLNLYGLALAPTGTGKDGMKRGLDRLASALLTRANLQTIGDIRGPSQIASYSALVKAVSKQPCCLSILGEFGFEIKKYSQMTQTNANNTNMAKALLEFYTRSGDGETFDGMKYSDGEKDVKRIQSPAFSILAESTPQVMFSNTNEDTIYSGLLPRFEIVEHDTGDVPLNEAASYAEPPDELVNNCKRVYFAAAGAVSQPGWHPIKVQIDAAAEVLRKKFESYVADRMRDKPEIDRALWSRVCLRSLKIAALLAIGQLPEIPTISEVDLHWAQRAVVYTCESLLAHYNAGDLEGSGDRKGEVILAEAIRRYYTDNIEALKGYRPRADLHAAHIIDWSFMSRFVNNHKFYKDDKTAFFRMVNHFLQSGVLYEIDKLDGKTRGQFNNVTSRLFRLLSFDELNKFCQNV